MSSTSIIFGASACATAEAPGVLVASYKQQQDIITYKTTILRVLNYKCQCLPPVSPSSLATCRPLFWPSSAVVARPLPNCLLATLKLQQMWHLSPHVPSSSLVEGVRCHHRSTTCLLPRTLPPPILGPSRSGCALDPRVSGQSQEEEALRSKHLYHPTRQDTSQTTYIHLAISIRGTFYCDYSPDQSDDLRSTPSLQLWGLCQCS